MTDQDMLVTRALVDYNTDGTFTVEGIRKPITYVLDGSGFFEVRKSRIGVSARKNPSEVAGLPSRLKEGFMLTIPPIPWSMYAQAVAFFRAVYARDKAEAFLQGWYDPVTKTWGWRCPEQEVSGGSVKYTNPDAVVADDNPAFHALEIHSHGGMSAFFSTTDDKDESKVERIYGVVGSVAEDIPPSKWRLWSGRGFLDIDMADVIDAAGTSLAVQLQVKDIMAGKVVFDPFVEVTFPAEWLEKVKAGGTAAHGAVVVNDYRGFHGFHGGYLDYDETEFGEYGSPTRQQEVDARMAALDAVSSTGKAPMDGRDVNCRECNVFPYRACSRHAVPHSTGKAGEKSLTKRERKALLKQRNAARQPKQQPRLVESRTGRVGGYHVWQGNVLKYVHPDGREEVVDKYGVNVNAK